MKFNMNDDNMNIGFNQEDNDNGFTIDKKEVRYLA